LQRLFSTFANGLPGAGLMLQRFAIAGILLHSAVAQLQAPSQLASVSLQILDICAGIFLLIGLWTPLVGTIIATRELWVFIAIPGNPGMPLVVAILAATLAMIGPGAWSVDALLFGRRQIKNVR